MPSGRYVSGQFGQGGLKIKFKVAETAGTRNELGRFESEGIKELMRSNAEIGEVLRSQLGRRMENRIKFGSRATASSGRLVAVTMSPKNQKLTRWSVGVGDIDYLNNSTAKYWRTFEEGSLAAWRHPFVGTQLIARYKAPFTRGAPSPHGTSLFTSRGGSRFAASSNGRPNFNNNAADDLFVVKHEIAPAHIYRAVFEDAHLATEGLLAARRFLDRIFTTPIKRTWGDWSK